MPTKCFLIDDFKHRDQIRKATGKTFAEAFGIGAMWECPWYFDPRGDEAAEKRKAVLELIANGTFDKRSMLSRHYWQDWSHRRPPLQVICPNGTQWLIDGGSTNGQGWQVTGFVPAITVHPSIVVPGYHGWLKDGVFSDDIEGRGERGKPE